MSETPRDGTPAFDDLDDLGVAFDEKRTLPMGRLRAPGSAVSDANDIGIGPAPDHATAYVDPRPLPPTSDHRTIEDISVKLSAQIDPRRMPTQKAVHVLQREQAQAALAAQREALAARQAQQQKSEADRNKLAGAIIAIVIGLAVVLTLGFVAYRMIFTAHDPEATTVEPLPPSTAAPAATHIPVLPALTGSAARDTPVPTVSATAAPLASASPDQPIPATKPKPKRSERGPRPINE
jgi:hypothetical protein